MHLAHRMHKTHVDEVCETIHWQTMNIKMKNKITVTKCLPHFSVMKRAYAMYFIIWLHV